jgi:outer membrane protein OmpA-like peptidoglycan-associated protein
MKRLIFCLLSVLSFLIIKAQEVVFNEGFENNSLAWMLPKSTTEEAKIQNGSLFWQHQDLAITTITQYINQLDDSKDFEVLATFKPYKLGSEFGFFWGGINKDNSNYMLLKGKKYRFFQIQNSKVVIDTDFKTSIYIRMDENQLTIRKTGNKISVLVNGTTLFEESTRVLMGKGYGFVTSNKTEVSIDNFVVKGTKLPIVIAPDLYYTEPPQNLGNKINTQYEELTPVITPNGKGIYFSRRHSPSNLGGSTDQQDIYYSEFYQGEWTSAYNIGKPLNNHGANAVCAVTPDGNKVLLMNTYDAAGNPERQGLSMSEKTTTGWSLPQAVKIKSYYNRSEFNEFILSNDGKILILAIDCGDTYGSRDLYVSFFEGNGVWSAPLNMGASINTPGTELSPFLASDGVTLYFSSTGHPGYGKNDIFMTKRLDESWTKWSEPKNLGKPINSEGIDAYYSVPANGEYAYFVSSAQTEGENDIFKIKLPSELKPDPVVLVRGYVLNAKNKQPIATGIHYQDLETGRELGIAQSDPKTGYYEIILPLNKAYAFFAEKESFYSVRDNLDLTEVLTYQEVERDLYLTPIEVGQKVQLNNVFFYRGKAQLQSSSYAELDKLVQMLQQNPRIEIELEGHTDNQGDPQLNQGLSEERVRAVEDYLVSKGVETGRISGRGYGGEKPIASNDTELTRKLNRRVEFKILKF